MKHVRYEEIALDAIVGGGQAIGTLENGKKALVWGGLPNETVRIRLTKQKSKFVEGIVEDVIAASPERIEPIDTETYLSTSPWQIMSFDAEQHYKAALIEEAFELHDIVLPEPITVYTNNDTSHYRNKVEFSWYSEVLGDDGSESLDLAFFRRGSKGKIIVTQCSLLPEGMLQLGFAIRDHLQAAGITARQLKTLLIRCNQRGECVWQLYVKDSSVSSAFEAFAGQLPALGGEVIYSDPKSPASRITKRLSAFGETVLTDTVMDVPFRYATEGFFQVNIPVYEQALRDMQQWVGDNPVVDLYSGVGSIGLTIGGKQVSLIELNPDAVREMKENIARLKREDEANAVLAPSEKALEYITGGATIILDPPRAGLHTDVINRLLEVTPARIIYLSCNPVTQARDTALLAEAYGIRAHQGYNFFPRTPHIEHLVILEHKKA